MKSKIIADMRAGDPELSEKEAGRRFDQVVSAISAVIDEGDTVRLPGIGSFTRKLRPAGTGRNPRTGEPIQIAEKSVIRFKQSSTAK